jgi:LuxR family transcriptional regulator, quorum-sensing system regulator BjaR1
MTRIESLIAELALELITLEECGRLASLLEFAERNEARRAMHALAADVDAAHPDLAALLREKPHSATADIIPFSGESARKTGRGIVAGKAAQTRALAQSAMAGSAALALSFINHLDQMEGVSDLVGAYQTLVSRVGFDSFAVIDASIAPRAPEERLWASTWPEAWLRHWTDRGYVDIDPVVCQLRRRGYPLRWSEAAMAANDAGLLVLDEAREFGLEEGFSVPIHDRDGGLVIVSTAGTQRDVSRTDQACLHFTSMYVHAKLKELRGRNPDGMLQARLTVRERECLEWVAEGKTDWEIGEILSIAESTANAHIERAKRKYGVRTRIQAVVTAIARGDISI